jgi:hypothetical protein
MLPKLFLALLVLLVFSLVLHELDCSAQSAALHVATASEPLPLPGAAQGAAVSPITAKGVAAAIVSTATVAAGCSIAEQPQPPLVLVHVGVSAAHFPAYIADTVRQALRWNPCLHVHLVLPASFLASDAGAGLRRMLRSSFTEDVAF